MRAEQTANKHSVWNQPDTRIFAAKSSRTIFAWFKIAGKQVRKSLKEPADDEPGVFKVGEHAPGLSGGADEHGAARGRPPGQKGFNRAWTLIDATGTEQRS